MSLATPSSILATAVAPLIDVVGGDLNVPVVPSGERRFVHLDYAASAPALTAVADEVTRFLPWYSSVHRGAGFTSTISSERLDDARETIRRFVGGRADDVVVITRNTTDSLNLLAHVLPEGTTVLTLDVEHHANLLPWRSRSVRHLPTPATAAEIPGVFDAALTELRGRPSLVAITGASNVTGEILPIAAIVEVARRHGARIVVDAAQLAPHRAIDIETLDVDYVAFSGHKLYAPFGAGALVGRRDWLDDAPPYLSGGGATYHVTVEEVGWYPAPARHEAGTPNVVGAVAIAAACDALSAAGFDAVAHHDDVLTAALLRGLEHIDGARAVAVFEPGHDRVGIVTIQTERPAAIVAAALSAEYGIATRDGAFCAHPLLRRLLPPLPTGHVPNALRASVGVGSRAEDVTTFLDALGAISATGPRWDYHAPAGRYTPNPDPRPRPRQRA